MRYWSLTMGLWTDEIAVGDKWKACVMTLGTGRAICITSKYKGAVNRELSNWSNIIYKTKKI